MKQNHMGIHLLQVVMVTGVALAGFSLAQLLDSANIFGTEFAVGGVGLLLLLAGIVVWEVAWRRGLK